MRPRFPGTETYFLAILARAGSYKKNHPFYGVFCKFRVPGKTKIEIGPFSDPRGGTGVPAQETWLIPVAVSAPGTDDSEATGQSMSFIT